MAWDKILLLLKNELNHNEYDRYIKQLKYDKRASKKDVKIFTAPNIIISKWITTKYGEKIANFYEKEEGNKPEIKISPKEQKAVVARAKKKVVQSILNSSYTFDSFVVGDSNRYAFTVAKSIADNPAKIYNPLFIYGPTGLGKTHLVHAIGNYAKDKGLSVIYNTIEQFTNDFTYNLRIKTMDRFRAKYRNCDLLLIDDIQFLSGKDQTQEEFFHTFNELHINNSQIILTSDKSPKKIIGLEDRLKSRFEWGLIAHITVPELETKIEIIKKKCVLDGIDLEDEVVSHIATNMGDNIREIESAIINLNAYASLTRQKMTLDFAKNVIKSQLKEKKNDASLEQIISVIASELNIKPSEIKSKKRNRAVVEARRIVIYLAKMHTKNSMPSLATFFEMKDHSSIYHNMKKVKELLKSDEKFKNRVEELKNKVFSKDIPN